MKSIWIFIALIMLTAMPAYCLTESDLTLTNRSVRFAIIGDRTGGAVPGIYEEIVGEVERMRPDFVMTVGDHIQGYTDDTTTLNKEWDEYFSIVKPLTMPLYLTPGNHDITSDAALGSFRHKVGAPYYSFNVGKYHFIVLDVTRWESSEELPKEELDWLAKDLAGHRDAAKTLVFYHKPFWFDSIVLGKPDTLHSLFVAGGVDAVFNGHLHSYFSAKLDGIIYTALGSSGGIIDQVITDLDYHFTWVTIDDTSITIAPIKKGSVQSWDMVSATEEHLIGDIRLHAVKFTSTASVTPDLRITDSKVQLEISNNAEQALNDTVKWQIPSGWSIQPAALAVTIPAKSKGDFTFDVTCAGSLYPVPAATINAPYGKGKTLAVSRNLRVARNASAPFVKKPPKIDGKLDDVCWDYANAVKSLFSPDGGPAKIDTTLFYFAYDKDNLYLAARCYESRMDSLCASVTTRDGGVYGEDCVGFFLQPDQTKDIAYQIYFNPVGTVFDQKIMLSSLGYFYADKSWNGAYVVKAGIGKDYWDIEARIPFKQLNVSGKSGTTWGANFLRKQKRLSNSADWQIPVDYDPETYGKLDLIK
jgi:hypothetical protein